jgi:hypothetical protein
VKTPEPDRRNGGTFIRDKDGKLLQHIPCTKPHAPATAPVPTAVAPAPVAAGKKE